MGILHYIDVGIGFSLGMIVLATLVGTFSAGWLAVINSRTRHVQRGLASLLAELTEGAGRAAATALSWKLLWDRTVKLSPLGGGGVNRFLRWIRQMSAETIQREEFALLLLRAAASGDADALRVLGLDRQAAGGLFESVSRTILQQEVDNPELPAQVWRTRALARHAPDVTAKLFTQFDNVMDRVEDHVKAAGKAASAFFALVFLCLYPVNSLDMLARLSADEPLRRELVERAKGLDERELERQVIESGLFGDAFASGPAWTREHAARVVSPGVLLTWVLVSLGAPFWMEVLNRLLGLRSIMDRKAIDQRSLRDRDLSRSGSASPRAPA